YRGMSLRLSLALVTLATTAGLVLMGCPFPTGGVTAGAGAGGSGSTSSTMSTTSYGGSTTSTSSITSSTSTPTCMPAGPTEVCTAGVDNDCTGHKDCEDPDCATQGFACSPAAPSGWTVVDFSTDDTKACATGYANAVKGRDLPTSAANC